MIKNRTILITIKSSILLLEVIVLIFLTGCDQKHDTIESAEMIGIGGYGAVFDASVNPFDKDSFAFASDMGGVYFSYDKGKSFSRHNLMGRIYNIEYDKSTLDTLWMCGSGVFKSEDAGKSVKMVFPQEKDLNSSGRNFENMNYWLYDNYNEGDVRKYPYSLQMKGLAINEDSIGKNVFVSAHDKWQKNKILIYKTENGSDFSLFFEKETPSAEECDIFYCESKDVLLLLINYDNRTEILEIDAFKNEEMVYSTEHKIIDFDKYYNKETKKNTFVFTQRREVNALGDGSAYDKYVKTDIMKVQDFKDKSTWQNLSLPLMDKNLGIENRFKEGKDEFVFEWELSKLCIVDENNIYLFQKTKVSSNSKSRTVYGYINYLNGKYKWVFGYPYKPHTQISNVSWQDGDQPACYGICGTKQDPNFLLFGTVVGLYYAEDCGKTVVQCNSNLHEEITLTTQTSTGVISEKSFKRYSSTGVDVQTTYEVITDPNNSDHIVATCTDIGLVHSYDGGKTWIRNVSSMDPQYRNTCYDFEFDKQRKGVAYSIWCGKHDAPYSPDESYLNCKGMFGISYDSGLTWEFSSIVNGDNILPYRMFVEYVGEDRTIYIAADGQGFFVSYDTGKTFSAFNKGIKYNTINNKSAIFANEIIKCNDGIFAIVSGSATETDSSFYRYDENIGCFYEIQLPENTGCLRDIDYNEKDKCLYLAVVGNKYINGGVLRYKDGVFDSVIDNESFFGVNTDSQGRLYAVSLESKIYRFSGDAEPEILQVLLHHSLKNVSFGVDDKLIYVTSFGGGICKIKLND